LFDETGRILVIREGYGSHRWGLPGGATEPGEDAPTTAAREAKEETGLDVGIEELVGEYRITRHDGELVVSVFTATVLGGVLRPGPDEIDEVAWVHPDALPTPMTTSAPVAIADAVNGRRGVSRMLRPVSASPVEPEHPEERERESDDRAIRGEP
jgi:8-oxo-dGTP diphosphatase